MSTSRPTFKRGDLVVTHGHWPNMPHVNNRLGRVVRMKDNWIVVIEFLDSDDCLAGRWTFDAYNVRPASIVDAVGKL